MSSSYASLQSKVALFFSINNNWTICPLFTFHFLNWWIEILIVTFLPSKYFPNCELRYHFLILLNKKEHLCNSFDFCYSFNLKIELGFNFSIRKNNQRNRHRFKKSTFTSINCITFTINIFNIATNKTWIWTLIYIFTSTTIYFITFVIDIINIPTSKSWT